MVRLIRSNILLRSASVKSHRARLCCFEAKMKKPGMGSSQSWFMIKSLSS